MLAAANPQPPALGHDETVESANGSMVDEFHVHPNTFRTLPVGTAVVYSRRTERRQIVRVYRRRD